MNITNDKVTEYINSFYTPLDEELCLLREKNEVDNIPLILKETEMFFRIFLKTLSPDNILEIGTGYGYSSIFFAKLLPNAHITTIEKSVKMAQIASRTIERLNLQHRIDIKEGDGGEILEKMEKTESIPAYDVVFIDAAKSHYSEFFSAAEKLCSKNAVIICDNVLMKASLVDSRYDPGRRHHTSIKKMKNFLKLLQARKDIDFSILPCGDGLAIIRL